MEYLKDGFLQSDKSIYSIPKLGLRILFPATLENKMKEIAVASKQFQEYSGTTVRLSKYRAYRYQTFDRECKIEGYGGDILRIMESVLKTLEPVYRIGKSECKSDLVHVIKKQRTVKLIVHRRVADKLNSFMEALNKTAKNTPLIKEVDIIKSRLAERCLILSGDSKRLMAACKGVLLKIIECTKPYWKKQPNLLNNELQQEIPKEVTRLSAPNTSGRLEQILLGKNIEGCLSFYNWLVNAGYSEDQILAMHLSALVKSQLLLNHKACSSKNDACDCAHPILEIFGHCVKSVRKCTFEQIQSKIEASKSYLSSHNSEPSHVMSDTVSVGKSQEDFYGKCGTISFECRSSEL